MTWHHIAEAKRCQGRPVDDEGKRGRRCKAILFVGARFWLDDPDHREKVQCLCSECALNPAIPKVTCPSESSARAPSA